MREVLASGASRGAIVAPISLKVVAPEILHTSSAVESVAIADCEVPQDASVLVVTRQWIEVIFAHMCRNKIQRNEMIRVAVDPLGQKDLGNSWETLSQA